MPAAHDGPSSVCVAAPNCSSRDSIIILSRHGQAQAGLGDRMMVISSIAVMA